MQALMQERLHRAKAQGSVPPMIQKTLTARKLRKAPALRVYSISLGCPKNRVDTERTLGALAPLQSIVAAPSPEKADLVFINTCAFIAPAVEETVRVLMETIDSVSGLPTQKRPLLAVAGCLVGRFGKKTLAPDLPEVDLLLDSDSLQNWPKLLREALLARGVSAVATSASEAGAKPAPKPAPKTAPKLTLGPAPEPGTRLLSTGPSYAWLKVSEGCRHSCAFCAIPSIRGKLVSQDAASLAAEAKMLLQRGVRELVLVAQDLTAWGMDRHEERGLIALLEKLLPLSGLDRLRLMYLYPAGLTRDLLGFLQQAGPPFVPYFDVPLQHAAQPVLSRMGRPFAGNPYEAVERIRSYFPEAALRTTCITGFPGETDKDFVELADFVSKSRFHHLGVFAYYAEDGTKAAAMPDQVEPSVREKRKDTLMALQREISEEIMQGYVSRHMDVLVDAPHPEWPGLHVGRTWFQAPEVDGVTYISGPGVAPGAMIRADIVENKEYDLVALADAAPEPENDVF